MKCVFLTELLFAATTIALVILVKETYVYDSGRIGKPSPFPRGLFSIQGLRGGRSATLLLLCCTQK